MKYKYKAMSVILLAAALWVLGVHVNGLRVVAGLILIVISEEVWNTKVQSPDK